MFDILTAKYTILVAKSFMRNRFVGLLALEEPGNEIKSNYANADT